ncbi:hypothetical protein [Ureibacillus terrenus]|uniref:hypothetical protein n=1 Tax=Ureibacillus terrenus TaxID=118246 RepID=UPI002E1F17C7|nr:hypothetical protein [Ureibacillus terrenus]
MDQIVLCRELRLKNLEAFQICKGDDAISLMLIADFRRPCTLDDFPYLKGIEGENEFGSSNFIKVFFIHGEPLNDRLKDVLIYITDTLLARRNDCLWNADFIKIKKEKFESIIENRKDMFECFSQILNKHGYKADFHHIRDEHFNYLSQD